MWIMKRGSRRFHKFIPTRKIRLKLGDKLHKKFLQPDFFQEGFNIIWGDNSDHYYRLDSALRFVNALIADFVRGPITHWERRRKVDAQVKTLYGVFMSNLIHSIDLSGAIFAFISTIYYVKADMLAWPMGLISSGLNIFLFAMTGIYGDMGCEMIYFISMLYGWYLWTHPRENQAEFPITNISSQQFWKLGSIAIISTFLLALFLAKYTNSQVPFWDASTTVLALTAQWMICKKIIECWYLWFIVDVMYIGLYFHKGIPAHGILFTIYLGLALAGLFNWRRLMNLSSTNAEQVFTP